MPPEELANLIEHACITTARAAELAGVAHRTMQQYLAGDRAMPRSASGMLCLSCIVLNLVTGDDVDWAAFWLPSDVKEAFKMTWLDQ